jgi:DNA-damage-inducible protein J
MFGVRFLIFLLFNYLDRSYLAVLQCSSKGMFMSSNSVVRARIDEHIKEEATVVLATMGLTVSDAFRMLLIRIAQEKTLPFEPLKPNEKTIEAMKAARSGQMVKVDNISHLLNSLNEDN